MSLRPYQTNLINKVINSFNIVNRLMMQLPTGGGKCLGSGTPVLMSNGSIKAVENIKVGDSLMGDDSLPRKVLSLANGRERMYRIKPIKGLEWECNESHILTLICSATVSKDFKKNQIIDISVRDYLQLPSHIKHVLKLYRVAIKDFHSEKKELKVNPYFLGILLGDGSLTHSIGVNTPDQEIVNELEQQAIVWNCHLRKDIDNRSKSDNYYFVSNVPIRGCKGGNNKLKNALVELGIHGCTAENKFIPFEYKIASWGERLELLAGLIDTDGHYTQKDFEFTSKSEQLAEDVCFIARSLGFRAYKRQKQVNNETYYRFHISGHLDKIPTKVKHKKANSREQVKDVLRTGFEIEDLGIGEYFGFEIDGNRRFLLGDCTVTHNTFLFSELINSWVNDGKRVLVLVHRKELIEQIYETLCKFGIYGGVIQADHKITNYELPVQVASVQTLINREFPQADYIVVDEAHHISPENSYGKILSQYQSAKVLGVTATPVRLDGKGFDGIFDELITEINVSELISQGFLADFDVYSCPVDLKGIKIKMGDYNEKQLGERLNNQEIIGDLVSSWVKYAYKKRTIVFAVNVGHSMNIVNRYREYGAKAAHIDGTTPKVMRDAIIDKFKAGELDILSNCNIVSEGFDVPACECVQLARPTKSLVLYLQQVGRGLRPFAGKDKAIILDHGNLIDTHGMPDFPFIWTLKGVEKGQGRNTAKNGKEELTEEEKTEQTVINELRHIELIKRDRNIHHDPYTERFVERFKFAINKGHKPIAAYYAWKHHDMNGTLPSKQQLETVAKYLKYKHGWVFHQLKLLEQERSPKLGELIA